MASPPPPGDAPAADPVGGVESVRLFRQALGERRSVLLAVSGGADSTALLVLAGEWAQTDGAPKIAVAIVDHALRPDSMKEAKAVKALAKRFRLPFKRLDGRFEPRDTRIEETARTVRYDALFAHARAIGAEAVATAHTLDDQAETVLMRLAAGSGPMGLAAMRLAASRDGVALVRPLLAVSKARLVATLRARGVSWAEDAMNADPRFARARLRRARAALEREGLTAERLGALAFRMARVNLAIEAAIDDAAAAHVARKRGRRIIAPSAAGLPDEIKLRLLGRVIGEMGGARVKLEALERLADRIVTEPSGVGTLAGTRVAWTAEGLVEVRLAPPRRGGAKPRGG